LRITSYDPTKYGETLGGDYDELYPDAAFATDATVARLAELAEARPERAVLEFGIGTGRLALPLYRRGLRVAGIDSSERIIAKLRAKPGGAEIEVGIGDYRTTHLDDTFSVVALVFNNIFDPRGRQAQRDLFRNAARHLNTGGYFVIEAFVLSDAQRSGEWSVTPRYVGTEHVELQLARFDIASSRLERTFVHMRPTGLEFITVADTYSTPGELDLMAEVAGFELVARSSDWSGEDFTAASVKHVSVYQLRERRERS
jgi:SAM-dependent methyltransferase